MSHEKIAIKTTYFSILGNVCLALFKALAGVFGNSYALIADAIESTTDIMLSILVLFGIKYSNKPADKNHPYGHGKAESILTFIIVVFLIISASTIAYHSIKNIGLSHESPKSWTLIVLGIIIAWKEFSYQMVIKKSALINSNSLRAEAWHHRIDAITSVAAFIGISIAVIFGKGFESADDWAALFASFFIFYNSYKIFKPALSEMMDEHIYDDLVFKIRQIAKNVDDILGTEKCFIRKAGMKYHVDLHIIVDGNISVKKGHALSHILKDKLKLEIEELGNVLIHIEPNN